MVVQFRVLGGTEVLVDGELVDVGHAKQRGVLGVLLTHANRPVPTDQLLDRIWGEHTPLRGRETLYGYLTRLRSALRATKGHAELVTTAPAVTSSAWMTTAWTYTSSTACSLKPATPRTTTRLRTCSSKPWRCGGARCCPS